MFLAALGVLGTGTRLFPHRQSGTDVLSLSATDAGHRIAANMRRCRIVLSLESASHEYNRHTRRAQPTVVRKNSITQARARLNIRGAGR